MDIATIVCVVVGVVGLAGTVLLWLRGRRGPALRLLAVALLPLALLLVGLLGLVVSGVLAIVGWAAHLVLSPLVWTGIGVLGLAVVLWVVGGRLTSRTPRQKSVATGEAKQVGSSSPKASKQQPGGRGTAQKSKPAPADDDLDEIEAILRSRGIE